MKKNIFSWMTIVLMAFVVCAGFSACGDDDDSGAETGRGSYATSDGQDVGTFQGAKRVFGDNLVKVVDHVTSTNRYEFTYDAKGYLTKLVKIDYWYNTDNTYITENDNTEYELIYSKNKVTVNRYQSGALTKTYNGTIGSNGFLSRFDEDGDEVYTFTYDNSGHMTRYTLTEDGEVDDDVYLTWSNGDVVSGENKDSSPEVYKVSYEYNGVGPFNNVVGIPDLDTMSTIDIDLYEFFIYGGFLGFGPVHLPVYSTELETKKDGTQTTETEVNTYEFDNQNRPIRLVKQSSKQSHDPSYTYTWEY